MLRKSQGAGVELSEQPDRRERHAGVFRQSRGVRAATTRSSVIHDAAYAALVFEGKPLSFLATPGAKDVGVELHSASKSFNMTGWRCGFVAGNELLVRAYGDVKDNTDSGQFLAIQHAAAYALTIRKSPKKSPPNTRAAWTGLVRGPADIRFRSAPNRKARFSFMSRRPKRRRDERQRLEFKNAEEVSQWLITEKLISTVPWDDAGAYLRFSVTFVAKDATEEKRVLAEIRTRLSDVTFEF